MGMQIGSMTSWTISWSTSFRHARRIYFNITYWYRNYLNQWKIQLKPPKKTEAKDLMPVVLKVHQWQYLN